MEVSNLFRTISTQIFLVCVIEGILSKVSGFCNQTSSGFTDCNNFTSTAAPPFRSTVYDDSEESAGSYSVFYTVAILFGVVGMPTAILCRVCWLRRLNSRYNRRLNDARRRHPNDPDRPEVFTVDIDPGSFLPSYEQTIAESPPPYDQLPPPYKLKKEKSSASLPSYTEGTDSPKTTETSYPVENVPPLPESSDRSSAPGSNDTNLSAEDVMRRLRRCYIPR